MRSLLRQSVDVPLDILVVDDGSTDDTAALVRSYQSDHAQIRYVHQHNQGVTRARNTGLNNLLPESAYITFLDSDDISPTGSLLTRLQIMKQQADCQLVYGRLTLTSEIDTETLAPSFNDETTTMMGVSLSCALIERELVERTGMMDEEMLQSEDTDYLLRIFEQPIQFEETETVCVYYRRHNENMTRKTAEVRRYFMLALQKSHRRRQANPKIKIRKPNFEFEMLTPKYSDV